MTAAQRKMAIATAARITRAFTLCCIGVASVTWAARADVLEISEDGQVVVLSGPALSHAPTHGARGDVAARLQNAAQISALSPELVSAVAWTESRFNDRAHSLAGAVGVMQLMPATAASLGVDPHDPAQNARGGATYLRQMLDAFDGDITMALAAYNAGPEAVRAHHGVPPYAETRAYVESVLNYMADQAANAVSEP